MFLYLVHDDENGKNQITLKKIQHLKLKLMERREERRWKGKSKNDPFHDF